MTRRRTTHPQDTTTAPATTGPAPAAEVAADPAAPPGHAINKQPTCYAAACPLPEFLDGAGLCGGHWALRPDLRKAARREG